MKFLHRYPSLNAYTLELDNLLIGINKKILRQSGGPGTLEEFELTNDEIDLLRQYYQEASLIVYGTLAPNRPNHDKVSHIKGNWHKGFIRGTLVNAGWGASQGYGGFKHVSPDEQQIIDAYVLISVELAGHWPYLDEFEGTAYKRLLAKFEDENGTVRVGYIYAINEAEK